MHPLLISLLLLTLLGVVLATTGVVLVFMARRRPQRAGDVDNATIVEFGHLSMALGGLMVVFCGPFGALLLHDYHGNAEERRAVETAQAPFIPHMCAYYDIYRAALRDLSGCDLAGDTTHQLREVYPTGAYPDAKAIPARKHRATARVLYLCCEEASMRFARENVRYATPGRRSGLIAATSPSEVEFLAVYVKTADEQVVVVVDVTTRQILGVRKLLPALNKQTEVVVARPGSGIQRVDDGINDHAGTITRVTSKLDDISIPEVVGDILGVPADS